ncbi:DUF3179 domain-containing protein [Winogradskyella ouciana]|uniref:DUF3179 domain-containing protein n=1 Tax=Winogradskyella ouciana TaxID=2608631 RepID=A0A7K1GEL4_9FLAO|nr:DUF3179 domain-containing protein [Winogradskyella ouciana]MTE26874.1 DUF3179 domain-containing protein [Winogradskyella ouciana]
MKIFNYLFAILFCLALVDCSSSNATGSDDGSMGTDDDGSTPSNTWLIPSDQVRDGGPGKDGIPSIDNPMFTNVASVNFLSDDELIVGIKQGDVVKAYPHYVIDWHEIVNDDVNGTDMTISYCPLTGTAFAWESLADSSFTTFGVSGLLYNSNLILYDRQTDSNWSQILQQCVNGELIGDTPEKIMVVETNWGTWKDAYPNSLVLNSNTGFSKPYGTYPYGPYKTSHDFFLFVPEILNPALPNKQRVFALMANNQSRVYKFSDFNNGNVLRENFFNKNFLIVGDENLIVAFELNGSNSNLTFTYDFQNSEAFFKDNEGSKWNMFGEAIEGPREGQKLTPANSVTSMWFAIAAFFPNPTIYQE